LGTVFILLQIQARRITDDDQFARAERLSQKFSSANPEGEHEAVDNFMTVMRRRMDELRVELCEKFPHSAHRLDSGVERGGLKNVIKGSNNDTAKEVKESHNDTAEAVQILLAEAIQDHGLDMIETINTLLDDYLRSIPAALRSQENLTRAKRAFTEMAKRIMNDQLLYLQVWFDFEEMKVEEMKAVTQELGAGKRQMEVLKREYKILSTNKDEWSAWITHVQKVVASGPVHARGASATTETESSAGEKQEVKEEPSRVPSDNSSNA
jgi:hypothetical protein